MKNKSHLAKATRPLGTILIHWRNPPIPPIERRPPKISFLRNRACPTPFRKRALPSPHMGVERSNAPPEESFERDAIEHCQRQRRARVRLAFASFVVGQPEAGHAGALGNIGLTETRTEPGGSQPVWDGPSCSAIRQEKS